METNHIVDFSDRLYKVVIALIVVAGLVGAGWVFSQFSALPQNAPHEITMTGEGKAYIKPDIATVSFGVTTQELKSQDAVNKNNEKMNVVIGAIKSLGVADKDIQTTLYNLTPVYEYGYSSMMGASAPSSMMYPTPVRTDKVFKGYSLQQQVTVKIRNFDNISAILSAATGNGSTNVGDLQFTVDDPEMARAQARAKAIDQAKEKMEILARQSGLHVGKLVNVYEGYNSYPQPMYAAGSAMKDTAVSNVAPQIQTGQMEVSSSVTLTYQVK